MNREDFTTRGECLNPEIESVDSAPSGTIACDTHTYVRAIAVDETLIFFFFPFFSSSLNLIERDIELSKCIIRVPFYFFPLPSIEKLKCPSFKSRDAENAS